MIASAHCFHLNFLKKRLKPCARFVPSVLKSNLSVNPFDANIAVFNAPAITSAVAVNTLFPFLSSENKPLRNDASPLPKPDALAYILSHSMPPTAFTRESLIDSPSPSRSLMLDLNFLNALGVSTHVPVPPPPEPPEPPPLPPFPEPEVLSLLCFEITFNSSNARVACWISFFAFLAFFATSPVFFPALPAASLKSSMESYAPFRLSASPDAPFLQISNQILIQGHLIPSRQTSLLFLPQYPKP